MITTNVMSLRVVLMNKLFVYLSKVLHNYVVLVQYEANLAPDNLFQA